MTSVSRQGRTDGSTAGDFKAAGCPLVRAGKMNAREANGLALVRTMFAGRRQGSGDAMAVVDQGM